MAVEVVHTLRASGGDYTTASAWNAAEARDLPAAGEIAVLECYNDWPGGLENRLTSNAAWVTDEDHYPWIRSAPGDGTNGPNHHRGVPGAGFVIHHFNEFFATIVFDGGRKVRITGIEVRHTNQSRSRRAIDDDTTGNGWIIEDVIDQSGLGVTAGTGGGWLRNVLHFKTNPGGTLVFGRGGSTPVYNSTFISLAGAAAGMSVNFSNHDLTVYNSVVVGAAIDNNAPGGSGFTGSNNATDHSEATSTLRGTDNVYGVDPETDFVDAANLDYRLTPSSRLRGAGADFSHLFDHDIAGNERGDSWDIGAFQYVDEEPDPPEEFSAADTLALAFSDTMALAPRPRAKDLGPLSVAEAFSTEGRVSTLDGATLPGVAEAPRTSAEVQGSEALGLPDTAEGPSLSVKAAVLEALSVSIIDSVGERMGAAASDRLSIQMADGWSLAALLTPIAESLALSLTDAAAAAPDLRVSEALELSLIEFVSRLDEGASHAVRDTLVLGLGALVEGPRASVEASDSAELTVAGLVSTLPIVELTDALEVGLAAVLAARGGGASLIEALELPGLTLQGAKTAPITSVVGYLQGRLELYVAMDGEVEMEVYPALDGELEIDP